MKTWHDEIPYDFNNPMINRTFTENALFFDIETTGFSREHTQLYLIGCAVRKKDSLIIDLFFADTPDEESDILNSFLTYLNGFDTIITFNGIGFDIPYIKAKCSKFHMPDPFETKNFIDIYKQVRGLKFLLALPDLKQKTIEQFLGMGREDLYNGGELIEVYQTYVKCPSDELLYLLKQHNYEDVLAMPQLFAILSYQEILSGGFSVSDIAGNQYTAYDGTVCKELLITLKNKITVPKRVSSHLEDFHLVIDKEDTTLCIRLLECELKYFFSDYRNYFYLPDEDIAVPKSVAASVDKERKKKATAATCYARKTAIFVPQCKELVQPAFRRTYKDKKSYFELSEEFVASSEMQKEYVMHVLQLFQSPKIK